jgi:hypothetical protein
MTGTNLPFLIMRLIHPLPPASMLQWIHLQTGVLIYVSAVDLFLDQVVPPSLKVFQIVLRVVSLRRLV